MGKILNPETVSHNDYKQIKAVESAACPIDLGEVIFKDNARIPLEGLASHAEDEYLFVADGELLFGTEENVCELTAGDFHYLPKNTPHWCQGKNGEGKFIYILVK